MGLRPDLDRHLAQTVQLPPRAAPQPKPILRSKESQIAHDYQFSAEDLRLLDEIQRGCFQYLWQEVGRPAGLAKDRRLADVSSVAAVGFQLSALPIGVERHWIKRSEAEARARSVLRSLIEVPNNKKFGIYLHFVDANTARPLADAPEHFASTIDHALLCAGALTVASYFRGEIAELCDKILEESNWRRFLRDEDRLLSMGWKPEGKDVLGPGVISPAYWQWASDEERLLYFLAVGCPVTKHRVSPDSYYRTRRLVKQHADFPPFVVSWNSTLFTYFFSHCWIDFGRLEADDPSQFGQPGPRVDWWENSRRAVMVHRDRCVAAAADFQTFAPNRWGLSPCTGYDERGTRAYLVPGLRPSAEDRDNWCRGTVAPYAAASAIMFTPAESLAALREMRNLTVDGRHVAWQGLGPTEYGFFDSFNLDEQWSSNDQVGIDVGPMLLAIENVRSGLIWRLFHDHPVARRAERRLKFRRRVGE